MKFIIALLSVFFGVQAIGQNIDSIYQEPDVMPEFVGGEVSLLTYLRETVVYPTEDLQNEIEGIALVRLVITEKGEITNVVIPEDAKEKCTSLMADEAIRVIKSMPKWKPGYVNGTPVKVVLTMPIRFSTGGKKSRKRKAKKSKD